MYAPAMAMRKYFRREDTLNGDEDLRVPGESGSGRLTRMMLYESNFRTDMRRFLSAVSNVQGLVTASSSFITASCPAVLAIMSAVFP